MNLPVLSLAFLRRRRLSGLLSICLLGFGLGMFDAVLLFSHQLRAGLDRNIGGIDLVVGAKGSPLQLILSSVFQADAPTGNIPLYEAQEIASRRAVRQAIPLALGDSYQSHRIVGTTESYAELYGGQLAEGRWWSSPLEVVIGQETAQKTGLSLGDGFESIHGFESDGHGHEEKMRVVGVLNPTGAVLDRLILTSVQTVWQVHGIHSEPDHDERDHAEHSDKHDHAEHGDENAHAEHADRHDHAEHSDEHDHAEHGDKHDPGHAEHNWDVLNSSDHSAEGLELTALLIQYSSPIAAARFPRTVNQTTTLQAASPAYETARLFALIGVGVDTLRAFGILLACGALLGVFVLLHEQLSELRRELGVLRLLGISKGKILGIVLLQGVLLGFAGSVFGLVLGHAGLAGLNSIMATSGIGSVGGLMWLPAELGVLLAGPILGAGAAFLPAWSAYQTQISPVLAES